MLEKLWSVLPTRRSVPLDFNGFWNEHGRGIMAMQNQIQKIRQKQISVVSQSDEGWAQGVPKPKNEFTYAEKYSNNLWVHVAVRSIASAAAMLELKTYRKHGNELQEVSQGLASELFKKPSLYETPNELKLGMFSSLLYAGNSYLYIDPDKRELWSLRPQHIKIVADRIDFIEKYKFCVPDYSFEYNLPPEQVVHVKEFNSQGYLYGMSRLAACYAQATLIDSDVSFWQNFWKHGGRVMGTWSHDSALSQLQYDRFEKQIKAKYKGIENMFRDILLEGGVKYEQLGVTQSDAKLIEKYKLSRDDILAAYSVPSSVAGVLDQANYSNMDVQERLFWQNAVLPVLTMFEEALGANQILSEGGSLVFRFDTSKVRVLQEIEKDKADFGQTLIASSQWTPNEVREKLWSKPPIEGGDTIKPLQSNPNSFFPPANQNQLSAKEAETPAVNKPRKPRKPYWSNEDSQAFAKSYDEDLIPHDKDLQKVVRSRLKNQGVLILENLRSLLREVGARAVDMGDFTRLTQGVQNGQEHFKELLKNEMLDVMIKFGNQAADSLKKQLRKSKSLKTKVTDFDFQDPKISQYLRHRSTFVAGEMDTFTLSFFREGLAAQLQDDSSITAVSKYIQNFFEGMETWRAIRIARTETAAAASYAINETFNENKDIIEQKEWVTAGDDFVRDSHRDVSPVEIGEDFILGSGVETSAPGNSGVADEDINCRCVIVAVVKQAEG